MKVNELLQEVSYSDAEKWLLGPVKEWAKEYGLTPEIVATAMDQVRKLPVYKELEELGLKELNVPKQRRNGTFNFKFGRRWKSDQKDLNPSSYLVYGNGQIRTARLSQKRGGDYGSTSSKPDVGFGFTRLTTPKPQLNKKDPLGSLVATYAASLEHLKQIRIKSKKYQEPDNLYAREILATPELVAGMKAGDEEAFKKHAKNIKKHIDNSKQTYGARQALETLRKRGLKSPHHKDVSDYLDKADIAHKIGMKGHEIDGLIAHDPELLRKFMTKLLASLKSEIGGYYSGFEHTKKIMDMAERLGIADALSNEFKTIKKSIIQSKKQQHDDDPDYAEY